MVPRCLTVACDIKLSYSGQEDPFLLDVSVFARCKRNRRGLFAWKKSVKDVNRDPQSTLFENGEVAIKVESLWNTSAVPDLLLSMELGFPANHPLKSCNPW